MNNIDFFYVNGFNILLGCFVFSSIGAKYY
jgi:hypothetical protein